jgi:hypothetical protein
MSKKISLKRLIEINQPNIIFLQETMGLGIEVITLLEKLLKSWNFSRIGFKFLWSGSKEFFFSLGKVGVIGNPKSAWRMGIKKYFTPFKSVGRKIYIETNINIYSMETCGHSKVHSTKF